ncbi:MAG: class I SAM-dependent methyltransferase [Polaromonas sp.]|nr:class I SAM-dependent methyltransferase [Polaromonas sp.]
MSDFFYRAFEDRFRGSRSLILARLDVYQPFLRPLVDAFQTPRALDLGCGRGEWLEVLVNSGFDATGVDLDEGMLAACQERGLKGQLGDALSTLKGLPSESLALVSAFHLVEHVPFEVVQGLVQEALRVLMPGGLLVLETPNSENLTVGTSSFYLDPSHKRPLPSALLAFVAEHAGFYRSKVMYLQEPANLHGDSRVGLLDVLSGVSPDYALVAQKSAAPAVGAEFDAPFNAKYGLSLDTLAQRYDAQTAQLSVQLGERSGQLEKAVAQLGAQLIQVQTQLEGMLGSRSWRITAPMRWLGGAARHVRQRLAQFFKSTP